MDFNRQNNQANTSFRAVDAPAPVHTNNGKKARRKFNLKGRNGTGWAIVLVAVVMIVFGLLWFFKVNGSSELSQVNSKEYQAIFLSNGQVYFGKLVTLNDDYAKITHIFYLQVKQTVQPNQSSSSDSQDQNPTLVKLGSEIHAPEDEMMINRSQIVFWENLKSNGKVSEAIQRYYSSGSSNTQTQSPASSQNSSSSTETTPQTNAPSTNTPATTNTESTGSNSSTGSTNSSAAKP